MRYCLALMLVAIPSTAYAGNPTYQNVVDGCAAVQESYGNWALDLRRNIASRDTDHGGPIDASLTQDINQGLVFARYFMQYNLKFAAEADIRNEVPTVESCKVISNIARGTVDQFVRAILHNVSPTDRTGREALVEKLRVDFSTLTLRIQHR